MSFKYESIDKRFLSEYRNGINFTVNPTTDFTTRLKGNPGDRVKYIESILVEVTFNPLEAVTISYENTTDVTNGKIESLGTDFRAEGFFEGATVDVFKGSDLIGEETINVITGPGNNTLRLTKANLDGGLSETTHDNVRIRLKDSPEYVEYKYNTIKNNIEEPTLENYKSAFDGNLQSYYAFTTATVQVDMIQPSSFKSWDLTESIKITRQNPVDTYRHQYDIEHVFIIPFYRDGQETNIDTLVPPDELADDYTYQYVNGYFLGGTDSDTVSQFEQLPLAGDVGYFEESFNGLESIFDIDSVVISNPSSTDTLEVTEVNSFTFNILADSASFAAGQRVVVGFSRLPDVSEYENKPETFATVWTYESLLQDEGAGAVSGSIIKNLVVTLNSATDIDVDFDIDLPLDTQGRISDGDQFIIWITVGDQSTTIPLENQVNLLYTNFANKNNDIDGLIYDYEPLFYNSFNSFAGSKTSTDWKGWDGDIVGYTADFKLLQFNDGTYSEITSIRSRIIAVSGSDEFEIFSKPLPIITGDILEASGYKYQVFDLSVNEGLNLPITEDLQNTIVQSVPSFPAAYQPVQIRTSLPRISWRDWIENLAVPMEFYDNTKPNNNRNQKTSNYSGSGLWEVFHELTIEVDKVTPAPEVQGQFQLADTRQSTTYKLRSDQFSILDFDVDGLGDPWSAVTELFDVAGDPTDTISSDEPTVIKITFTHASGVLSAQDLAGYIWIEKENTTALPWALHTHRDWTNDNNPLTGSQEVSSTNFAFVEVTSALNEVVFYCKTNPDNIESGFTYNVYGRPEKQTP